MRDRNESDVEDKTDSEEIVIPMRNGKQEGRLHAIGRRGYGPHADSSVGSGGEGSCVYVYFCSVSISFIFLFFDFLSLLGATVHGRCLEDVAREPARSVLECATTGLGHWLCVLAF